MMGRRVYLTVNLLLEIVQVIFLFQGFSFLSK